MGTPKMVPPILGNSNMQLARELQAAQRMLTRSEQEVRKPKRAGISWLSHVEGCVNCGPPLGALNSDFDNLMWRSCREGSGI